MQAKVIPAMQAVRTACDALARGVPGRALSLGANRSLSA